MGRWKTIETDFGPVSLDTHWVCGIEPFLPRFRVYESAGLRAVVARWHRHMPFPQSYRFPTTRAV